jgi:hypothetical protein
MVHRLVFTLTLAALAVGLAGCGRGTGDVAGKITFKSKPLVFGSVQFVGADNQLHLGAIAPDGTYSVQSITAGENRVLVHSPNPAYVVPLDKQGRPREKPAVDPKLWFPVPDKYSDPSQSDLVFTIEAGKINTFDIELK